MSNELVITTGLRSNPELEQLARELSNKLNINYIPREKHSIEVIKEATGAASVVIVNKEKILLYTAGKEFFFHPGLAKLRIKELQAGKTDQMIKAMDLHKGDTVLDCTLGLAADAIVASYVCGQGGKVVGIESSPLVAEIVRRGLKTYSGEKAELLDSMSRVEVVNVNHLTYLCQLADNSFDVVYFDPMFRKPREQSSSMGTLRPVANNSALDYRAVTEALRVAKKRVVMKESRFSEEFNRLKFHTIQGGQYSPVAYGIINKVVP